MCQALYLHSVSRLLVAKSGLLTALLPELVLSGLWIRSVAGTLHVLLMVNMHKTHLLNEGSCPGGDYRHLLLSENLICSWKESLYNLTPWSLSLEGMSWLWETC